MGRELGNVSRDGEVMDVGGASILGRGEMREQS